MKKHSPQDDQKFLERIDAFHERWQPHLEMAFYLLLICGLFFSITSLGKTLYTHLTDPPPNYQLISSR